MSYKGSSENRPNRSYRLLALLDRLRVACDGILQLTLLRDASRHGAQEDDEHQWRQRHLDHNFPPVVGPLCSESREDNTSGPRGDEGRGVACGFDVRL
jgi:hypothetical protein